MCDGLKNYITSVCKHKCDVAATNLSDRDKKYASECSPSDCYDFPVRGVLKEFYLIIWKQYTTVLIIFATCSQ